MDATTHSRLRFRKPSGVALFLVLAFLALIITLVLAFFSSVTSELSSARSMASEVTAKQLGDTAVQVVSSVIRMATSSSSKNVSWASQPGMIRTYGISSSDPSTTLASPLAYYKLYSSDDMEVTHEEIAKFNTAADPNPDLVGDWDSKPALFTDLNSPVLDGSKKPHFPIIDPRVQANAGSVVDGFSYSATTAARSDGSTVNMGSKVVTDSSVPDNQRLPMPVKWIYLLKDGTLTAPRGVDGTGKIANWTGASTDKTPSTTNPIVGRIAFWTDDESCKVNINTASEGVYWDVPRIYSKEDFGQYSGSTVSVPGMAVCQPAQKEYQRYPGHPATTCLSPVFNSLLPVTTPYPANPASSDATKLDPYYSIAPRIGLNAGAGGGGGGSIGGSYQVPNGDTTLLSNRDTDRLYASVDELIFSPLRVPNGAGKITKEELEKRKFFLTAASSAPEVTLRNTPRIAMWPISPTRTAYDSLLAFCSTIGGQPYYFTRTNSRSGTIDYAGRNVLLYQYLQSLTGKNVPGFGGNFLSKYSAGSSGVTDRDQILTYIYDYIRCTNLQDGSTGATPYTKTYSWAFQGGGEVIPIRIGQTQGFGRFLSISSAHLLFYGTHSGTTGKVDKMRAMFFVEFATPMHGMAAMRSATKYKVFGLENLQANVGTGPSSLNFQPGGINRMTKPDLSIWAGRDVGGSEHALQAIVKNNQGTPWPDSAAGQDSKATGFYPFFSQSDISIAGQTTFSLPAPLGEIKMEIWPDEDAGNSDAVIQTVHFKFPAGTFKVPGIVTPPSHNFGQRNLSGSLGVFAFPDNKDTIISLEVAGTAGNSPAQADDPTSGDNRMVESLIDVPAEKFRAHNDYQTLGGTQFAHGLNMSTGDIMNQGKYGPLVAFANYSNINHYRQPNVPSRVPIGTGVQRGDGGSGDWDTGLGDQVDGAYINKPDEGDTALTDITSGQIRLPYMLGYGKGYAAATNTYFSPNRQIPSPMMLGSIPTGVQRGRPWQTLLFHPRPEDVAHPGKVSPPDHLIADLFWMPVVEPYAISQPFATSGKINMNYQIMPFAYIKRSTGMYAVMKSTKFAALPVGDSTTYKPLDASGSGIAPTNPNRRYAIDMPATLVAFDSKFASPDMANNFFKSATQISEMNLFPAGKGLTTSSDMANFWGQNTLTGDNLREKPYVDLYSRLTTKSNVYTVHFRVQVLKKARATDAAKWDETKDIILSENRGSSLIERYIDVSDPVLADPTNDFATVSGLSIDKFYKFRVLSTKKIGVK